MGSGVSIELFRQTHLVISLDFMTGVFFVLVDWLQERHFLAPMKQAIQINTVYLTDRWYASGQAPQNFFYHSSGFCDSTKRSWNPDPKGPSFGSLSIRWSQVSSILKAASASVSRLPEISSWEIQRLSSRGRWKSWGT